jgi:chemotaxis-related protein WspD
MNDDASARQPDDLSPTVRAEAAPQPSMPGREYGEQCWRHIGVTGDRSCKELQTYIHCRNCPVMAEAARAFFDRSAPIGYLESWSGILEERGPQPDPEVVSVLVFRLADEWLALPTAVLVEVTKDRRCHRVPHRTGGVLEGLVNIRGQLQLCVSARRLLGIEDGAPGHAPPATNPLRTDDVELSRLLVVERQGRHGPDRWVFPVDQVAGVVRVGQATLRAVPATVSQSGARYCQALFDWHELIVGILDETRFLDALHGHVRTN